MEPLAIANGRCGYDAKGLPFAKGHGTGNDFVHRARPRRRARCSPPDAGGRAVRPPPRASAATACCGWSGPRPSPRSADRAGEAEWFMDYRNADGSLAEMCGNGVRVYARYLVESGLAGRAPGSPILTRAGLVVAEVGDDDRRRPHAAAPGVRPEPGPTVRCGLRRAPWRPAATRTWSAGSTIPARLDLDRYARCSTRPSFPDGANVEFVAPVGAAARADAGHRARRGRDAVLRLRRLRGGRRGAARRGRPTAPSPSTSPAAG